MAEDIKQAVARRRTFAIISHPDAGKTTLTEKLLLFGGAIQLAGEVKAKKDRMKTRSDWMKIERERGISVVTSVMTFEYGDNVFNLLDTPGHEDFADDTYRTLTAVDSAVMVIDAAKGIEPRTLKLFEVCRLRDIPIVTFVNKMDREARNTFEILDEIEQKLALDTAPITWPIGQGKTFSGTYHLAAERRAPRRRGGRAHQGQRRRLRAASPACCRRTSATTFIEELELAREACRPFDLTAFREGHLTPVYFGSALRNFGVRDLIEALGAYRAAAARPGGRHAHGRRRPKPKMTRLRLQDPGQHGPQPPRPHRLRARLLGHAGARHEGQAGAHRQADEPVGAAVLLRPHAHHRRRGLCRRRRRHPQPRHAAHRRHADRGRGHLCSAACRTSRRKSCAACGSATR